MSPLYEGLIQTGISRYTGEVLGSDFNFLYRKIDKTRIYQDENELKQASELIRQSFDRDFGYLEGLLTECGKRCGELYRSAVELSERHQEGHLPRTEIRKLLGSYFDRVARIMPYLPLFPSVFDGIAEEILENIAKDKEVRRKLLTAVRANVKKKGYPAKERMAFYRLASAVADDGHLFAVFSEDAETIQNALQAEYPVIYGRISEHSERYGWLKMEHLKGEPWNEADVISMLKQTQEEDKLQKLQEEVFKTQSAENLSEIAARFGFEGDALRKLALLKDIFYWRGSRKPYIEKSAYMIRPLFEEVCDMFGIPYTLLINLTAGEILEQLEQPVREELEEKAESRAESYAMIMLDGKIRIFPNTSDDIPETEELHFSPDMTEIIGRGTHPGTTEGYVRLVLRKEDIEELKEGEIYITPRITETDLMVAEELGVSGIVTDEGSLTAHSSGLEADIPMVVGTKGATRVFHTGDYVSVDGDSGTVKKISKS
jgi:phosphohistidine swiveling domain-containing protein